MKWIGKQPEDVSSHHFTYSNNCTCWIKWIKAPFFLFASQCHFEQKWIRINWNWVTFSDEFDWFLWIKLCCLTNNNDNHHCHIDLCCFRSVFWIKLLTHFCWRTVMNRIIAINNWSNCEKLQHFFFIPSILPQFNWKSNLIRRENVDLILNQQRFFKYALRIWIFRKKIKSKIKISTTTTKKMIFTIACSDDEVKNNEQTTWDGTVCRRRRRLWSQIVISIWIEIIYRFETRCKCVRAKRVLSLGRDFFFVGDINQFVWKVYDLGFDYHVIHHLNWTEGPRNKQQHTKNKSSMMCKRFNQIKRENFD